jgi:hypothetical protein
MNPRSVREWLELFFGIALVSVVFLPSFLGAAALNDARRYMRRDPAMEAVPNFLALYFGCVGGSLYVHRRVREVLALPTYTSLERPHEG